MTDSGPEGCDGEKRKGTGKLKSKKLQRTTNQFKNIFPSLPGGIRFIREQADFPHFSVRAAGQPLRERHDSYLRGRSGTCFQSLRRGEGLLLCSGTWSCRADQYPVPGQLLLQQQTSRGWQFQGTGCSQREGELGKGGQSTCWVSSLWNAAVLRVLLWRTIL